MIRPSQNPVTLRFGATTTPYSPQEPHRGVDFGHSPNATIYAPFTGTVLLRPNNGRDGNGVYMQNGNQFHGLLHCVRYLVQDGAHVTEGQPIAVMGDTGYAQGIHLHWAVKVGGQFIDPLTLVQGDGMAYIADDKLKELEKWATIGKELTKQRDTVDYPAIDTLRAEVAKLKPDAEAWRKFVKDVKEKV
jgi:murein DD-endopeptidase MepM/ murein hydrolase activator NlpD